MVGARVGGLHLRTREGKGGAACDTRWRGGVVFLGAGIRTIYMVWAFCVADKT